MNSEVQALERRLSKSATPWDADAVARDILFPNRWGHDIESDITALPVFACGDWHDVPTVRE